MQTAEQSPNTPHDLLALLKWHVDMGLDEVVADTPQDRFKAPAPQKKAVTAVKPAPTTGTQPSAPVVRPMATTPSGATPDEAIANAQNSARSANTLDELRLTLENFAGCGLKNTAMNTILGAGAPDAEIMIIGRAPGPEDDRAGLPFQGPSGDLLDKMLAAIALNRDSNVYLTTALPWRPPGNRKPSEGELAICRPFLLRQIELVAPRILVLMGGMACAAVLGGNPAINGLRGKWQSVTIGDKVVNVMPSYHPDHLLQHPRAKKQAWHDLLEIKAKINE